MRRLLRILLVLLLFPPLLSMIAGWMGAPGFLHPEKRELTPDMVRDADVTFAQIGAHREDFQLQAPDGTTLRGWKVRAAKPNGSWVLVFHGVADNRYGMTEHARLLLQGGYNVVMVDQRAHGASGGDKASYGWLERKDCSAVIDELERAEYPEHLFALGNSMGAGIALESAEPTPGSKRSQRRRRSRICRKRPTTMQDCKSGHCSEKRCLRRAHGY
jgi:pimeloyl-ACP methyl ester carboxylesterase